MGIDRHEWEHRNYKSGRVLKTAPALQPGLEDDPLVHDGSLGDAAPASDKPAPVKDKAVPAKDKAAPVKGKATPASKPVSKSAAKAGRSKTPAKTSARAR